MPIIVLTHAIIKKIVLDEVIEFGLISFHLLWHPHLAGPIWKISDFCWNLCYELEGCHFVQWLSEQIEYPQNRKISCSCLDTDDPKMIDTPFESPEYKL